MKTYGLPETQTLVSIVLDENGDPRLDTLAPNPRPEDWTPPDIVPLVKIEKPADTATHTSEPVLVWFDDRVERQWQAFPIPPDALAALARKTWPNAAAFLGEFSLPELAAISLSTDPTIAALRLLLASWAADVWSDDARIQMGLEKLVETGIINEARKAVILQKV